MPSSFQKQHQAVRGNETKEEAEMWARVLGLTADEIIAKCPRADIDLTFDDADMKYGKVNVKVKRLNNHIVRYPDKIKE